MNITGAFRKVESILKGISNQTIKAEPQLLMMGRLLALSILAKKKIESLSEVEFKVFSQWGDDGIIQWLVNNIELPNKTFIEFGVADYRESNTRFLMMHNNWSGLVMDGSQDNIDKIVNSEYYWQYELTARCAFIDADNINGLLAAAHPAKETGLLHIDLDGNDYWIWKKIDAVNPILVILEYNAVFGMDRAITTPYDKAFQRTQAHHSNLYFGASLLALHQLSAEKGYAFIGCNLAGNNAYFVRRDKLNEVVKEVSFEQGCKPSKFRESRNAEGHLTYLTAAHRLDAIQGMPVFNTATGQIEDL